MLYCSELYMNRLKKFDNKSPYLYIMSFAVTFLLYLLLGFVLKLYPSRENTILFSDMNAQFVSFYTFFKNGPVYTLVCAGLFFCFIVC